jgi:hypothetical protein
MPCDGIASLRSQRRGGFGAKTSHDIRLAKRWVPVLTPRSNFFIIFVDGIFTTFIACLFTNTSDAIRENSAIACV